MSKSVILYSKPNCMQCNFTKQFFEDNNISYELKDVSLSEAVLEEVKNMGFQSLPVVVIENQKPFSGFRPDLLESLIG